MNRARWPVLVFAACTAGCGSPRGGGRPADGAAYAQGPFAPVSIEVHPLTRLIAGNAGEWSIDAHIEFLDAAGDEVKATGRLTLELYRETGAVMEKAGRQHLLQWDTDLADLRENSRAFDRVTRTYRFELSGVPETAGPSGGLRLRATLTRDDGRELTSEAAIRQ